MSEEFEYGVYEPKEVKPGKITLRQSLEFLNKHSANPETYTADIIAKEYKMEPKVIGNTHTLFY